MGTRPIDSGIHMDQLLRRAELDYDAVTHLAPAPLPVAAPVARQVEIEIKYEGYIRRQLNEIERFRHLEQVRLPDDFDFFRVHGLSNELKEKLDRVRPASLGQASRISGITPAAISVLMVALRALAKGGGDEQRP
jgi:tRNA uridine 5-carboxymethylaminomethyl modification enzyme